MSEAVKRAEYPPVTGSLLTGVVSCILTVSNPLKIVLFGSRVRDDAGPERDLLTARRGLASDGPYNTACFHARQAAGRYPKGFLALAERPIPNPSRPRPGGTERSLRRARADLVIHGRTSLSTHPLRRGDALRLRLLFWLGRETAEVALPKDDPHRFLAQARVKELRIQWQG